MSDDVERVMGLAREMAQADRMSRAAGDSMLAIHAERAAEKEAALRAEVERLVWTQSQLAEELIATREAGNRLLDRAERAEREKDVAESFHRVAVKERDYARRQGDEALALLLEARPHVRYAYSYRMDDESDEYKLLVRIDALTGREEE